MTAILNENEHTWAFFWQHMGSIYFVEMGRREEVLRAVEELISRLELTESQPFRVKAYERLWEVLASLPMEKWLSFRSIEESLSDIPGIGEGLRRTARELYERGTTPLLEKLRAEVPDSVLELRRLPGLGPQRIRKLWQEMGIVSIDSLAQAIERGKLQNSEGWTPALIQRLAEGLAIYRQQRHLLLYWEASQIWQQAISPLQGRGLLVMPVGEFRRALPLITQVEGLLSTEGIALAEALGWKREASGNLLHPTLPVRLHLADTRAWGRALLAHTGPEFFWREMEKRLPPTAEAASEEALFETVGLPYILPAWRDWEDVFDLAQRRQLPMPLDESHIKGSLHIHTTYSDGADSLEVMVERARQYGWKWIGIADHSQRAAYAKGLPPQKLFQQGEEIDLLNRRYQGSFFILKGVEADILPDGSVDYEEKVWKRLDFIIASIHEKLQMRKEEAMQRLERALSNPYVRVLGHWTGRLLRTRPGYPIDEERILAICAERGIAIEFNANPYRMEIDWRWVRRAAEYGVSIILTTDAHSVSELEYWKAGLSTLQKGLLPPNLLLNNSEYPPFAPTTER
ncbi:MAG: PHP domain-containing protein [Bacteroidia bacterium]|nr:PHP domain-containing protein [Bacteroidia bacterium]